MGLVTTWTFAVCFLLGMFLEAGSKPVFTTCPANVTINETVSHSIFHEFKATGATSYKKQGETGNGNYFSVNNQNGSLSITEVDVDTIQQNVFNIAVIANDSTDTANCTLTVTITDVNDNIPIFDKLEYTVNLKNHVKKGSSVIIVTATDSDRTSPNNQTSYSLNGTNKDDFAINATAGIITVNAKNLSAAVTKSYSLQVLAIDGGTPANTGTANLNVCVGCESGGKNGNIGQTWSRAAFVGSLVSLVLLQQL